MRVAAICCIRNEQDIIEAFIRHTAVYCDDIVILDHGSTDRSAEILRSLQKEGLPLHLLHDATLGHLEVEFTKRVVLIAAHDLCADWILPLDADELIDGAADRSFLPEPGEVCLKLKMRNYHCHPGDDARLLNPVERMAHRLEREPWPEGDPLQYKTMVPGALARFNGARFTQGKHRFLADGLEADSRVIEKVWLAHFSLRSASQYACKLMSKKLQEIRHVDNGSEDRKFYDKHYDILRRSYSEFDAEFGKIRMSWLCDDGLEKMVRDPMRYLGGALRYTPEIEGTDAAFRSLFSLAERLAQPLVETNTTNQKRQSFAIAATSLPVPQRRKECAVETLNSVFQTVWLPIECLPQTERIRFTFDCSPGVVEIRRIVFRSADELGEGNVVENYTLYEKLSVVAGAARVVSNSSYVRLLISNRQAVLDFTIKGLREPEKFTEVGIEFFHEDTNVAHVVFSPYVLEKINEEQKQLISAKHELSVAKQELAQVRSKLEHLGCGELDAVLGRFRGVSRVGSAIDFTPGGNAEIFKRSGWSFAEEWGTRTNGTRALLHTRFDPLPGVSIWMRITARAFVRPAEKMRVAVSINQHKLGEWMIGEQSDIYTVQIPVEKLSAELCEITFDMENSVSPNEIGIGVTRIEFNKQPADRSWKRLLRLSA
jgi:glycosyltransferase involved in cell wall biosynthesis